MNVGRIIWWLAFVVLVLSCAGAVALTTWAHNGEEQNIQEYVKATHSWLDNLQQSEAAKAARFEQAVLLKSWCINHGMAGGGIKLIVILFSCLSLFLLITCLAQRRRAIDP